MLALLALFYYLDANFAIKYLLGYTSMILFMFFLTFILIEFSFFTPVDTLNLAVRCSPSYTNQRQKGVVKKMEDK